MFLHVVIVRWRSDADAADIDAFVTKASKVLEASPFRSCTHGRCLDLGIVPSASDWGYVAEVDGPDDLREWEESAAHQALAEQLKPILDSVLNIQLPALMSP